MGEVKVIVISRNHILYRRLEDDVLVKGYNDFRSTKLPVLTNDGWIVNCITCQKTITTICAVQPHCGDCGHREWKNNINGIRLCVRCQEVPPASRENPYSNGTWGNQCHKCELIEPIRSELRCYPDIPYSCGGRRCGECAKCHVDMVVGNMDRAAGRR